MSYKLESSEKIWIILSILDFSNNLPIKADEHEHGLYGKYTHDINHENVFGGSGVELVSIGIGFARRSWEPIDNLRQNKFS